MTLFEFHIGIWRVTVCHLSIQIYNNIHLKELTAAILSACQLLVHMRRYISTVNLMDNIK